MTAHMRENWGDVPKLSCLVTGIKKKEGVTKGSLAGLRAPGSIETHSETSSQRSDQRPQETCLLKSQPLTFCYESNDCWGPSSQVHKGVWFSTFYRGERPDGTERVSGFPFITQTGSRKVICAQAFRVPKATLCARDSTVTGCATPNIIPLILVIDESHSAEPSTSCCSFLERPQDLVFTFPSSIKTWRRVPCGSQSVHCSELRKNAREGQLRRHPSSGHQTVCRDRHDPGTSSLTKLLFMTVMVADVCQTGLVSEPWTSKSDPLFLQ